jgi:hypothetical protein
MNGTHTKLHLQEVGPYVFRYVHFTAMQWHSLVMGIELLLSFKERPSI